MSPRYKQLMEENNGLSGSTGSEHEPNTDKSENDFIYPRRRYKKRLGNAQPLTNSNFVGGDRKVWLYLYRVKRECDENAILRYIKTKDGFENLLITVRELPTDQNKLKCFVVTAPLQKKDTMYDPNGLILRSTGLF
ncbi:unnamed protein product [Ceutorhynchus assimilis]|uniref:Uncharacterized protein n=1 Tax=Ceutorhynchus assimilis TaxID=467358 RepID=A0A9N9QRG3_9CUCU|nr:unnamed protein product [Ceutorhynchus assimilis]